MNKKYLVYLLTAFMGVSAYEVYGAVLSDLNFGINLALFSSLTLVSLRFLYPSVEHWALRWAGVRYEKDTLYMPWSEVWKRQRLPLIMAGVSSFAGFALMLPFLKSVDTALLFIIFYSLSGILTSALARKLFGDPIQNLKVYFVGLSIAMIGAVLYGVDPQNISLGNLSVLGFALLKLGIDVGSSLLLRQITDKDVAGARAVPVKRHSEVTQFFDAGAALLFVGVALMQGESLGLEQAGLPQLLGILHIGVVVAVTATLSGRFCNLIKNTAAQPIGALRPVFAFVLLWIFGNELSPEAIQLKGLAVLLVALGSFISLRFGKPFPKETNTSQTPSSPTSSISFLPKTKNAL